MLSNFAAVCNVHLRPAKSASEPQRTTVVDGRRQLQELLPEIGLIEKTRCANVPGTSPGRDVSPMKTVDVPVPPLSARPAVVKLAKGSSWNSHTMPGRMNDAVPARRTHLSQHDQPLRFSR